MKTGENPSNASDNVEKPNFTKIVSNYKIAMNAKFCLSICALMLFTGLHMEAQQQTFISELYSFTNGSDGANPAGSLILSGNTLYGTAQYGGTNGDGTVFAVNTNGMGFSPLHTFGGKDGNDPQAGLISSGNILYGTTYEGGANGRGTIFEVNADGTGFAVLHNFSALVNNTNGDGANPYSGLILSGNTLYGTAYAGGTNGNGTIFEVNTDGTEFTVLHNFSAVAGNKSINSDGANPYSGLILSGNTLYGTAQYGGTNGNGTVFTVSTNGTGFADLHSFSALVNNTNGDGADPYGGLILSDNTLYGTTVGGGTYGNGAVFALNTNGAGFTILHVFSTLVNNTNDDGALPYDGLILSGNILYATTYYGGISGNGTVYAVNTNGTGFTTLHDFTGGDGLKPQAGLILSGNIFYGTTSEGGADGCGTMFSLAPPPSVPPLYIASANNLAVIFYATAGTNYTLQMTTNLASGTWVNVTNSVPLVAVGITNSAAAAFFRLH